MYYNPGILKAKWTLDNHDQIIFRGSAVGMGLWTITGDYKVRTFQRWESDTCSDSGARSERLTREPAEKGPFTEMWVLTQ